MKAGRKSTLSKELTLKIRAMVLEGELYKDIQTKLNINPNNWDTWVYIDFQGFRANLLKWKHERMVKKAESRLDISIDSEEDRVALDATKFTLSRLDKTNYSDRTEHTGKDGKDLIPKPLLDNVRDNNSTKEDNKAPKKN